MDHSPHIDAAAAAVPSMHLGDWQLITDGVYRLVAEPASVNIGLVVGDDGALVIDTGSSPAQGAELRAAVATVTDRPIRAVVVTHSHFDHSFGLAGFAGIPTIGHETLTDPATDAEAARTAARLGFDAADLVAPTELIAVADAVDLGGQRVAEIVHLGEGHTHGDLVVTISDPGTDGFPGVIFAGDLVESAPQPDRAAPWFGSDSAIDQWSWTVDRLRGLATEQTIIVPGHGDPVDQEFVREQRDALDAVRIEINRLFLEGIPEAEAAAQGSWPFPAENVAGGIAPGYAELRTAGAQAPGAGQRPTLPLA